MSKDFWTVKCLVSFAEVYWDIAQRRSGVWLPGGGEEHILHALRTYVLMRDSREGVKFSRLLCKTGNYFGTIAQQVNEMRRCFLYEEPYFKPGIQNVSTVLKNISVS